MFFNVTSTTTVFTVRLALILLKHDSTLGAVSILWILSGGHKYLATPFWLRLPDVPGGRSAEASGHKVGNFKQAAEVQPPLTPDQQDVPVTMKQQRSAFDIAPAVTVVNVTPNVQTCAPITAVDTASSSPFTDNPLPTFSLSLSLLIWHLPSLWLQLR